MRSRRPLLSPTPAVPARGAGVPAPAAHHGEALDPALRAGFETRFGHDFGQVRVHTDTQAAAAAHAARAQACTIGDDIVFGAGRYAPGSTAGRALIAHELAHVVQQSRGGSAHGAEERADAAAAQALGGGAVSAQALGGAPTGLQAKPDGAPLATPMLPASTQSVDSVELEPGESAAKDNPKLVQIAEAWKAQSAQGGAARIGLSAYIPSDLKYDTAKERVQRAELTTRMRALRDALQALGVPADAIDLAPATGYATSAHGQVSIDVSKRVPLASPFAPPLVPPAPGGALPPTNVPPAPAPAMPSLNLEFTFGPVTVSLPKEVRTKLPIPLAGAHKLTISLGYEVPARFSFAITLDGVPHVRISLKAGAEVDAKNAAVTGSAGLQIETTSKVCNAPDPGETREKIKAAGDKLNKAVQEYEAATGDDKLGKVFDIASAIGEMYDAVDKAKSKCKEVPRATIEFGYKRLLTPGSETDPTKLPPSEYLGITGTFHF